MSYQQTLPAEVSLTATATAAVELDVDDKVALWRVEELKRAGYSPEGAAKLGHWGHLDLHYAIEMRQKGCPEDTALEILL